MPERTLKDDGNTEYETRRESRQERMAAAKILWPHELVFADGKEACGREQSE